MNRLMETYKDGEPSENDIGDDGDANVKLEGYRDIRGPTNGACQWSNRPKWGRRWRVCELNDARDEIID